MTSMTSEFLDLFVEIRLLLVTWIFNWAAQCGLPRRTTVKLIRYLAKYKWAGHCDAAVGFTEIVLEHDEDYRSGRPAGGCRDPEFIPYNLLEYKLIFRTELYYWRMHFLLTDLKSGLERPRWLELCKYSFRAWIYRQIFARISKHCFCLTTRSFLR